LPYPFDEHAGGREVVQAEPVSSRNPRTDQYDPVVVLHEVGDGLRIRQRPRHHIGPPREAAKSRSAIGCEQYGSTVAPLDPGCIHRRVTIIEALRRQPVDLPQQQAPIPLGDLFGPRHVVHRDQIRNATLEQRGDRGCGAQNVDYDIAVALDAERFRWQQGNVNPCGHPPSMPHQPHSRQPVLSCYSMDARPVGIFDSGVGGLSVLRHFQRIAPAERLIYFADTAYFPYGPRPAAEVRKRSFAITHRLLEANAKLIIVACNTASAAAIADLREAFPVPFVGMVPGVKPAAGLSKSGRVVILATPGTLDGGLYARVVTEFGAGTTIVSTPGHELAEIVEDGESGTPRARSAVRAALQPQVQAGADTVVLGCTHYHFLAADIQAEFPDIAIVDTSEPVARRALQVLDESGLAAPVGAFGSLDLIVTGDRMAFRQKMEKLGFSATISPAEAAS
jgi:glutamate racemase